VIGQKRDWEGREGGERKLKMTWEIGKGARRREGKRREGRACKGRGKEGKDDGEVVEGAEGGGGKRGEDVSKGGRS